MYVNFGPLVINIDIPFKLFLSERETLETVQKFWKEIFGGKRFKTMKKLTGSKTSANKIPVWNAA